jgi:hypothetical protein
MECRSFVITRWDSGLETPAALLLEGDHKDGETDDKQQLQSPKTYFAGQRETNPRDTYMCTPLEEVIFQTLVRQRYLSIKATFELVCKIVNCTSFHVVNRAIRPDQFDVINSFILFTPKEENKISWRTQKI